MTLRKLDAILLNARDNVATSLRPLRSGEIANVKNESGELRVMLQNHVPPGHKFAIQDIKSGDQLIKFGEVIGMATTDIRSGEHAHTQNVISLHGRGTQKT